jgi:hypothetical protein
MPFGHPLVSSILVSMGRLERDEQRRLFGVDVPAWELGNFYDKNGEVKVQAQRLNPFFNALEWQGPQSAMGVVSPLVGITLNTIAGKNIIYDRPYTASGSPSWAVRGSDLGAEARGRIVLSELLRLSPYYRMGEKATYRGRQSSDALVWSPRPVQYADRGTPLPSLFAEQGTPQTPKQRNEARMRREEQRGTGAVWREGLVPLLGQDARESVISARDFAAQQREERERKRRRGKPSLFGSAQLPDLLAR